MLSTINHSHLAGVGQFGFLDGLAFPTTEVVRVDCGDPVCGSTVDENNGPFSFIAKDWEASSVASPTSDNPIQHRIVGGHDAAPTKYPFIVALYRDGM